MKETARLNEISKGLQKESKSAIHIVNSLKMIIFNLKIQAAYIDSSDQKAATSFTIDKLTSEINQLNDDINNVCNIGAKMATVDYSEENLVSLVEELESIAHDLKRESINTVIFLDKLKYVCINLEIQATHMGNSKEAHAISVIVNALVNEISTIKTSALLVQESSNEVNRIIEILKEQIIEKPKVKTK